MVDVEGKKSGIEETLSKSLQTTVPYNVFMQEATAILIDDIKRSELLEKIE